jgi:hypothetical protein
MSSDRAHENGNEGLLTPPAGRLWRKVLPVLFSIGLLAWLAHRISLDQVIAAARQVEWGFLAALTVSVVVTLYLWDTQCIRWVFAQSLGFVGYGTALRARGSSYLVGAVNYSLGQGVLAWLLARSLGISVVAALGRLLLVAYHDLWLLLTFGLVGSLTQADPSLRSTRLFCEAGLLVLASLTGIALLFPGNWQRRVRGTRWAYWLEGWSWGRSLSLFAMRLLNFGFSAIYAATGLSLIHVPWTASALLRSISLIQLAEALPITMSGLGTRETILLAVLNPEHPERVLAFGLFWSVGLIMGRLVIGSVSLAISGRLVASGTSKDTLATSVASATIESRLRARACGTHPSLSGKRER